MALDELTGLKADRRWQRAFENICQRILNGEGSGHGENYRPWLNITRRNTSPVSNQIAVWMPPLNRKAVYYARGEYRVALLLLWAGAIDVREQYPIWPVPHPHPLEGAKFVEAKLKWSRGLFNIAAEAGIDHGTEIGVNLPYVATIDLLATMANGASTQLFVFSLKPIDDTDHSIDWRTAERLELERRYALEVAQGYSLVNTGIVPDTMASNLEQWMSCCTLAHIPLLQEQAARFSRVAEENRQLPARDVVELAEKACAIDEMTSWQLLRHCAWHQLIDIDPARPFLSSYPLQPGGRLCKARLSRQLFKQH